MFTLARIIEALEAVFDPETMFVTPNDLRKAKGKGKDKYPASAKGTGKGKKILAIHASHPYLMVVQQAVDDDVNAD